MEEVWKEIKESSMYDISNLGRVRSWKNNKWGVAKKPKILKQTLGSHGYLGCAIHKNKKQFTLSIHKTVLETFNKRKPTNKHECAHNNGNRCDNRITNLRWATRKENMGDNIKNGTICHGERNNLSKLKGKEVVYIRYLYEKGVDILFISKMFLIHFYTAKRVVLKKTWKHI